MTPQDFYRTYIDAARAGELGLGIPALFALAQSALETGWGRHAPGHMMFGIKAGAGWTGRRQLCVTREVLADARQGHRFAEVLAITPRGDGRFDYKVRDWFRAYDSVVESFADHAFMLRENPRYVRCFETKDPREFARRIAAAGYATDPGYAASLVATIGVLEKFSLQDAPAAVAEESPTASARDRGGLFGGLFRLLVNLFGRRA